MYTGAKIVEALSRLPQYLRFGGRIGLRNDPVQLRKARSLIWGQRSSFFEFCDITYSGQLRAKLAGRSRITEVRKW